MQALIEATVAGLGYELIEVERAPRGLLRLTIDLPAARIDAGELLNVHDCEKVTRQLQYALEVEGVDYARLEVGSPGVDRPLKKHDDFVRFAGEQVLVVLHETFEGRKRYQGILKAPQVSGALTAQASEYTVVYAANASAKLIAKAQAEGKPLSKTAQKKADADAVFAELNFALHEVAEVRLDPTLSFKFKAAPGDETNEES
jgi:ribosome maturation factor RimP